MLTVISRTSLAKVALGIRVSTELWSVRISFSTRGGGRYIGGLLSERGRPRELGKGLGTFLGCARTGVERGVPRGDSSGVFLVATEAVRVNLSGAGVSRR